MRLSTLLGWAVAVALSQITEARPMGHYDGLSEMYLPSFGSNIIANDTAAVPSSSTASATDPSKTEPTCQPFRMPPVPMECRQKSGELVCHDYSLYCRYPADWGVAYDPMGECWTCK
ncbi:hypothetical protein M426DRAFT_16817 [Hypoxylon sp. CI-4A]|nr:hypothetical protein M426DRAFT_16817 [Hypoxylon sp. CI-4A]